MKVAAVRIPPARISTTIQAQKEIRNHTMKTCSKCKQNKQLSEFHKNRCRNDGLQDYCKSCDKFYHSNYYQTKQGKATRKRSDKRFNARHPKYHKATHAVNNAIRDGKLPRANTWLCHYCPKPAQQYHHWHGYEPEHWLDVVPACRKCDYKEHRKIA